LFVSPFLIFTALSPLKGRQSLLASVSTRPGIDRDGALNAIGSTPPTAQVFRIPAYCIHQNTLGDVLSTRVIAFHFTIILNTIIERSTAPKSNLPGINSGIL